MAVRIPPDLAAFGDKLLADIRRAVDDEGGDFPLSSLLPSMWPLQSLQMPAAIATVFAALLTAPKVGTRAHCRTLAGLLLEEIDARADSERPITIPHDEWCAYIAREELAAGGELAASVRTRWAERPVVLVLLDRILESEGP